MNRMRMRVYSAVLLTVFVAGCATVKKETDDETGKKVDSELLSRLEKAGDKIIIENREFLEYDKKTPETYRVLLTSKHYIVSQLKYRSTIERVSDPGGDSYICDEIKRHNKIDEVREGLITLWLYPDSGNIMKVRPQRPTYIVEIDRLLTEDIQRWNFKFPKTVVHPTRLDIRYRVILRKTISDEDILKEVQQKMRDDS
jgi:hypothetical protein